MSASPCHIMGKTQKFRGQNVKFVGKQKVYISSILKFDFPNLIENTNYPTKSSKYYAYIAFFLYFLMNSNTSSKKLVGFSACNQ